MTRDEARQLIGGYTAGNLTPEQESALLSLALEDQEIFNELMAEQPLKELFDDPATRRDLLAALEEEDERPAAVVVPTLPWWRKPLTWGLAGSLAGGVITAGLLIYRPGGTPVNQAAAPPTIIASKTSHEEPLPPAPAPSGALATPAPDAAAKPAEPRRMMKKVAPPPTEAATAPAPASPAKPATDAGSSNSSDAAAEPTMRAEVSASRAKTAAPTPVPMAAPAPAPPPPPAQSQLAENSALLPPAPVATPVPALPPREAVARTMVESSTPKLSVAGAARPGAAASGMMFKARASAPFEAMLERFDPSGSFVAATAPFDVSAAATPRLRVTGQAPLYFYVVQRGGAGGWEYLYESRTPESLVLTPVHTAASGPQRAVVVSSPTPLTHADVESAIARTGPNVRDVRFTLH